MSKVLTKPICCTIFRTVGRFFDLFLLEIIDMLENELLVSFGIFSCALVFMILHIADASVLKRQIHDGGVDGLMSVGEPVERVPTAVCSGMSRFCGDCTHFGVHECTPECGAPGKCKLNRDVPCRKTVPR